MNFSAFKALWLHRYRKYTYILGEYVRAWGTIARFFALKISFMGRKKLVAILRTEHFGDIVAAEPIARQVRALTPNAYIVWIVRPVFKELVERHPEIDKVWAQPSVLRRKLVCESGVFDRVHNLEFWQSNRDPISEHVHKNQVAAQKDITVFNYFEKGNLLTIFQQCAELPIVDDAPRVYIDDADRAQVDTLGLPEKLIVIHCSSNYPTKDWSVENWHKLVNWLMLEKGYYVAEIGLKNVINTTNSHYLNLCGQFSILQTAEIIRRAQFFIGIDSGPAHLANAVGTYGILLFGRLNNFDSYMPYSGNYQNGKNALFIREPGKTCAALNYTLVQARIETIFAGIPKAESVL
ncbi:glycosyltransferase family 9 protein [Runella sp.]|uniref:glycosyltransferase family 9 protein n=1 Tax=Runella sp. TaxID=1960881 RepID=UPI003D0E5ABE